MSVDHTTLMPKQLFIVSTPENERPFEGGPRLQDVLNDLSVVHSVGVYKLVRTEAHVHESVYRIRKAKPTEKPGDRTDNEDGE